MPRIRSVETVVLAVDAEDPYLGVLPSGDRPPSDRYFRRPPWRSLYSSRFETLLVRLECDDGSYGWGEALAPVAPEVPAAVVRHLLAPVLLESDPRESAVLRVRLSDLMRERGHLGGHQADALAAVDIALWDLKGKLAGEPIAGLLGGPFRTRLPVYVSGLPRPDDEGRAALAAEWAERGATAVKLALGYGVVADLATVDAVQAAAPGLRVGVDAHWAYDLADALRLGRGLDVRRGWFLEAPLVPEDVAAHAELAAALDTPVAIGEALRHRWEFRPFVDGRAVDLCQPDVARTGITEAVAIIDYAEAHHLRVAPHHSTGMGVALAAGLHVAAARSSVEVFEYQPGTFPVANALLVDPIAGDAAHLKLPTGPGLGVDVDDSRLAGAERTVIS